jgi:hypothetical protein
MENFDLSASHIQLKAGQRDELSRALHRSPDVRPSIELTEPPVPFQQLYWRDFQAQEPFDAICLTRSPSYTPEASDHLFDLIRKRYIRAITIPS